MLTKRNSTRYRQFADALRRARKDRGMTQEQLAKKLRVPQPWISKVERNERRLNVVELEVWCKGLGITLIDFLSTF
jgi:transcriptional regulator with XRE-family HTH domain